MESGGAKFRRRLPRGGLAGRRPAGNTRPLLCIRVRQRGHTALGPFLPSHCMVSWCPHLGQTTSSLGIKNSPRPSNESAGIRLLSGDTAGILYRLTARIFLLTQVDQAQRSGGFNAGALLI